MSENKVPLEFDKTEMTTQIEEKLLKTSNSISELECKRKEPEWIAKQRIPKTIIILSVIQIIVFCIPYDSIQQWLRFDPKKPEQAWRPLTYMLVHEDWLHLLLNIMMQIIIASFLEYQHGAIRTLTLYIGGGISAALGASCIHSDILVGGSGGVYALLISHLADLIINLKTIKWKLYRTISIGLIIVCDVTYNCVHESMRDEPTISWGAHLTGGIAGFLLGLAVLRRDSQTKSRLAISLFYTGIVGYSILFSSFVIVSLIK